MKAGSITDVAGVLVGHAQDTEAVTGCTVVLTKAGAVCGVDVRGGAPGTRETDLLNPVSAVSQVHAVLLTGGSALGMASATGVVQWLYEQGIGYDVGVGRVPLVPAAVILDLHIGRADRWPDAPMGYAACEQANTLVAEGCVGAGMGASIGHILGKKAAMKSGLGTSSETLNDGTTIGAIAVCNAFGDVWHDGGGILAGTRDLKRGGLADSTRLLRQKKVQRTLSMHQQRVVRTTNTTLGVVATDAQLTKTEATIVARMAQDALARTIRPIHTPFDGDTVFVISTGQQAAPHLAILGSIAADVLARAIIRCVTEATSIEEMPALRDWGAKPATS